MIWQRVRIALLAGAFLASVVSVRAEGEAALPPAGAPASGSAAPVVTSAPGACCPQQTMKVCCKEWVPETYQCCRTVYKTQCRQECYTAYRCECVPQSCTRTCVTYQMVPECKTVMKTVCECVPCVETRTVMKTCVTCKPVTCMVRTCEDHGHYECQQVPCGPSFRDRLKKLCGRKRNNCCDPCNSCCEPCCPPPMKTVRVWVPCKVWVEKPVCKMQRVCECHPVTCQVTTYKMVPKQVACQVTCCRCVAVPKTENYTVMVTKRVPYQCTRTVQVCVPCQETCTKTRMVCRTVIKDVPCCSTVSSCCQSCCCETSCCQTSCCSKRRHCRR